MTFNIFMTKRVSCFGQYNRIDDLIPFNLRGDKRPAPRQFLIDELHVSAVCKCFDPLFVWHFLVSSSRDQCFLAVSLMLQRGPVSAFIAGIMRTLPCALQ